MNRSGPVRLVEQRYRAVRGALDGSPVGEVAVRYGVSRQTPARLRVLPGCRDPRGAVAAPARFGGDLLWHPSGNPVLFRACVSLLDTGLADSAVAYWQGITVISRRLLGDQRPETLTARANLAAFHEEAERMGNTS